MASKMHTDYKILQILRNVFKTRSSCAMSMIPWVKPRIWFTMADYTTGKRDLINGHSTTFGKAWRLFGMFEVGWWKRRFWIIPYTVGHKWNKFHPIVSWGNLIGLVGHDIVLHLALAVIWSMNSNQRPEKFTEMEMYQVVIYLWTDESRWQCLTGTHRSTNVLSKNAGIPSEY